MIYNQRQIKGTYHGRKLFSRSAGGTVGHNRTLVNAIGSIDDFWLSGVGYVRPRATKTTNILRICYTRIPTIAL